MSATSATIHRIDGKPLSDVFGVERTTDSGTGSDLSGFAKKLRAMIESGMIDAADAVTVAAEKAKAGAPKVKKPLNTVIGFSVAVEAGDAFHDARERHREIARKRTDLFMETKYVAHFPGQTLGERKTDLMTEFKAAISDHKAARNQLHKMAQDRQVVSVARQEDLHELRVRKATVAERIYDAGIASGRIKRDDSVLLTKQDKIRFAFAEDKDLAKQARLERAEIRNEMKVTNSEARADLSARDKKYAELASGNGAASRMIRRLVVAGFETVKAAFTSFKELDHKVDYKVRRGFGRIGLENTKLADSTHGLIDGVMHGAKAGVVEAASKTADAVVMTARRPFRPAMAT